MTLPRKTALQPRTRLVTKSSMRSTVKVPRTPLKAKKKAKSKAWKFKPTELAECDAATSKEVRERDQVCQFPGCGTSENLTCSHYIGRGNWNTRFLLSNLLLICTRHHFFDRNVGYEFQKARKEKEGWDGQYTLHTKRILGEEGFSELIHTSQGKKTRKEAIIETQKKYGLRQPFIENNLAG